MHSIGHEELLRGLLHHARDDFGVTFDQRLIDDEYKFIV